MNIYEQFYDSQKYGKVFDKEFIFNFVSHYCDKLELGNSIENLAFLESEEDKKLLNGPAGYLSAKYILINRDKMIDEAVRLYNINRKKCTPSDITCINLYIIFLLFHEIMHAKQHDMINGYKKGNKEIVEMFKNSFKNTLDPYLYTNENHDIFLTEYNANFEGALLTDSFCDELIEMYNNKNNNKLYDLVDLFVDEGYKNLSPLENYNRITNENIKQLEGLDSFDKLRYGMPLNEKELEKAKTLKYAKENNIKIKKYMKS